MKFNLLSAALAAALSVSSPTVLGAAPLQEDAAPAGDAQNRAPQPATASSSATELGAVEVEGQAARTTGRDLARSEKRYSGAVTEVLSGESMSLRGDSDAGSALKRVTGLTLVDDQYIYVRGLGERYSSVLLNGARIPSPDPTRRVVPMDLFPSAVLDSVVVRKSASAELPGHFGGGTVLLRTLRYPQEFVASFEVGGKWDSDATGKQGLVYSGGARDWTGFDNDARDLPPSLRPGSDAAPLVPASPLNPDGLSAEQLEQLGEQVAAGSVYRTQRSSLDPGAGVSASLGNSWQFSDTLKGGFLAALRYSNMWDHRSETRRTFAATNQGLELADDLNVERSSQDIELSGFFSAGLDIGSDHQLGLTHMLLRQTQDWSKLSEGRSENQRLQRYELRWVENELRSTQFTGRHNLPGYTELTWQYTDAKAIREEPNTRRWRRDDDDGDGIYELSDRTDSNSQTTAYLEDDVRDVSVELSKPFEFGPDIWMMLAVGHSSMSRDRDALLRSFAFDGQVNNSLLPLPQEDVLQPEHIGPGGLTLEETTLPTDNYRATQDLDAWYVKADLTLFNDWRLVAGARLEDNQQEVITADLTNPDAPPVVASIDESRILPSAALTWTMNPNDQLRLAWTKSLSRPDFRELSPAPFLDPVLDLVTLGNPDLKTTTIRNIDLRWEHYFDEVGTMAVALFHKKFENPIEKTFSTGGSTQFIHLRNALSATVYGIELDYHHSLGFLDNQNWLKWLPLSWRDYYLGGNYARIESSVELDPTVTSQTSTEDRPLQGASPYAANLQLGYRAPDGSRDWTLMYHVFGERIARAGVAGQPDVYQQPVPQLDLVYHQRIGDRTSLSLELGNLLDPVVKYTQGDKITRSYHEGRRVEISLEVSL